jgi:hypothetical protein
VSVVGRPGPFGLTGRWAKVVWIVSALSVVALVYGLVRVNGFGSNLFAEAVGIALGIPIALALLSRLDDEQRRVQWRAVSAQVGRSIATIAHETTFEIWSRLPRRAREQVRNPVLIPHGTLPEIIGRLATACHHAATLPTQDDAASKAYTAVEPTLNYLSGVLALRVAAAGVDLELLARLADVEEAGRQWAYTLRLASEGSLPHEQVWSNAAALVEAMAPLARHVELFVGRPLQLQV